MTLISSTSNPKIKQVRALRQRKARQESGTFLVEGIHPVGEAVAAAAAGRRTRIEMIVYAPDLLSSDFALRLVAEQVQAGISCYPTTAEVFESIADKDNPQGVLAVVRLAQPDITYLNPGNFPWGVALVAPQDPGNLGTILRTIDAVGADGLILLESSVDPYHPSVVRASMGALFWHPVVSATFNEFAHWAKQHSYHLYGSSAHAAIDHQQITAYQRPCILLLGSERQGLTNEQAGLCDTMICLPMHGRVTSLNLAVASGVLLYDMLAKFGSEL